jgi:hypothetical protein
MVVTAALVLLNAAFVPVEVATIIIIRVVIETPETGIMVFAVSVMVFAVSIMVFAVSVMVSAVLVVVFAVLPLPLRHDR